MMSSRPSLIAAAVAFLAVASGCGVAVRGSKLSDRPYDGRGIYLSTGTADRPFRTLGFVQVRGYGVEIAGVMDAGDAALDGAIRGHLADAAARMGGDGVIHIEFLDENPSTPVERANAAATSVGNLSRPPSQGGGGGVQTKNRYVTVTGEVIQFLEAPRSTTASAIPSAPQKASLR